jgi:two-component system phosphate regulon sensor histidine kinase PhoR
MANRLNLEEVFSNLIGNAINYTPENGHITIDAAVEGDYVCIRVTDTGIGIAAEDRDRIFDRFYRVKNAKTRFVGRYRTGAAHCQKYRGCPPWFAPR